MRLIDAYAHVGLPRFASSADTLFVLDRWGIEKANLVLFPGCPDFDSLTEVREFAGDRIRLFGVPFGTDDTRRLGMMEMQLEMGVSGFRFMPFEIQPNLPGLEALGEAGRWLFLINPFQNDEVLDFAVSWLEKHPGARIASPHFVNLCPLPQLAVDQGLLNALLSHPRFFVILSRHGGASAEKYPHEDLRPWLESVVEAVNWERLLWGSEFPVLHLRDELIPEARDWVRQLLPGMSSEQAELFYSANAERLFFSSPAPTPSAVRLPDWFHHGRGEGESLPLLGRDFLMAPVALACKLNHHYFRENKPEMPLRKSEFILRMLESGLDQLHADE